jgi:hypothetical protein
VLGPHDTGMPWFRAGMSGHARLVRITGHMLFTAMTWDGNGS